MARKVLRNHSDACRYSLIGERQKGHVYYRCQTLACPTKTIREENVETRLRSKFAGLALDPEELQEAERWFARESASYDVLRVEKLEKCRLRLSQIRPRLARMTDAFVDGILEHDLFAERKEALLLEERELQDQIKALDNSSNGLNRLKQFLELAKSAKDAYEIANPERKREFVKELTSNLGAIEKSLSITLKPEAELLLNRHQHNDCSPYIGTPRTLTAILEELLKNFNANPAAEI